MDTDSAGARWASLMLLQSADASVAREITTFEVLTFLGLLVLSGVFSGSESAMTAVNPLRLRSEVRDGSKAAAVVERLLAEPSRLISALLIGNNVVNVALTTFAAIVFSQAFLGLLDGNEGMAATASAVVSIVFLLVFGEVIPKTIGVNMPLPVAKLVAYPIAFVVWVSTPLTWLLWSLQRGVLRLFGHREENGGMQVTSDDLKTIVEIAQSQDLIRDHSSSAISKLVSLHETHVREVMTPRIDVVGVPKDMGYDDLVHNFVTHRFSRMPCYQNDIDEITGIVNIRDILAVPKGERQTFTAERIQRCAMYVPQTMPVDALIQRMRQEKVHLAVVVDEFGGTSGVVSLEDLLEEVVGQIEDEFDVEPPRIRRVSAHAFLVDGSCTISEFEAELGEEIDDEEDEVEEVDTVAGLFLREFGKIPSEGDIVAFKNMELVVRRMKGQRITRMLVRALPLPRTLVQSRMSKRTSTLQAGA